MKINHLIKLPLVLFAFSGFVACSSSSEVAQIQADYEAGNLTLEQRDAAIAAQREEEQAEQAKRRAEREEERAEQAKRRAASIIGISIIQP